AGDAIERHLNDVEQTIAEMGIEALVATRYAKYRSIGRWIDTEEARLRDGANDRAPNGADRASPHPHAAFQ
ncbi:MAG TPA: hypothetical protein VHA53_08840, partial [Nitrolancea sp.]|nr:hypothetical protein [Nitrolancea sp.]